jgi:hypothetical protein
VFADAHASHAVNPLRNQRRTGIGLMAMASLETAMCLHVSHLIQPFTSHLEVSCLQSAFMLSCIVSSHRFPTRLDRACEID